MRLLLLTLSAYFTIAAIGGESLLSGAAAIVCAYAAGARTRSP